MKPSKMGLYSEKKKRKARSSEAPKGCHWPGLGRNIFPLEPQQGLVAESIHIHDPIINRWCSTNDNTNGPRTSSSLPPSSKLPPPPPHHQHQRVQKPHLYAVRLPQPHILSNSLTNPPLLVFVLESATPPTSPPSSYYPRPVVVPS